MKVAKTLTLNERMPMQEQIRMVDLAIRKLYEPFRGRISFGTGTSGHGGENIAGEFREFTTNATPDTEDTVSHTMGSIPIGFIVLWQDKAGSLYQGPATGTAWTSSNIYTKCNVASVTFKLFLVKGVSPRQ